MSTELQRQQALLQALLSGEPAEGLSAAAHGVKRGLQAYRVNAQAVAARALAAVYAPLYEELGEEQFAAMAWAFWRRQPPVQGDLARWGGGLADFMALQPQVPATLVDQARLLWARHEAEQAADAQLDADSLQWLDGRHEAAALSLRLMPGLCLVERQAGPVLVWRRDWRAVSEHLPVAETLFFHRLLAGLSLGEALDATLAAHPDFDFSAWLQRALREPWLQAVEVI
ncbi:putative DNA-binding domain-containing protein [Pelomonas sp. V22]|uniref:HvfC/BufC family peptide modification chaperone n=1 Tax=Pelomonas sp. V22 TaxID=2822139 RepID=UPI0024A94540|nr:putative DNA-binding domain-containing protein [Pelomonas sp. V22]MDI4631520.1 putative DNA-binding domain-containing protein [Pelomonas sp. V22]